MSSQINSNKKRNKDPNEMNIEEDNFNLLPSYDSQIEKNLQRETEPLPDLAYKNLEPKKEIFEFNAHELHWSTDDYFRVVYFKLNEIKQFKDSNKPAEFRNIPIEFSETNRKLSLDLTFEFEEETLNLNLKFTHLLTENRIVNNGKNGFKIKDEDLISNETPDEENSSLDINNADKSNKMEMDIVLEGERDQMRGGPKNSFDNNKKIVKESDANQIQKEALQGFCNDSELKNQIVNTQIDDINHINKIKQNKGNTEHNNYIDGYAEKNSSNNFYKYETGNSILRGRAKKPLFDFQHGKDIKRNKNLNEGKNKNQNNTKYNKLRDDYNNLNSLQSLELNSDLIDQENKLGVNTYNNKNKTLKFDPASIKKAKKILIDVESLNMDIESNPNTNNDNIRNDGLNKDKEAEEQNQLMENDMFENQNNLFRNEEENNPNTIDNLYSDVFNSTNKKSFDDCLNFNSAQNDFKRVTRGSKTKYEPELIDLTGENEDEISANSLGNIKCNKGSKSTDASKNKNANFNSNVKHDDKKDINSNYSDANYNYNINDFNNSNTKKNKSNNNNIPSKNMMDQEIIELSQSEAEAENESFKKNINQIEKLTKEKNKILSENCNRKQNSSLDENIDKDNKHCNVNNNNQIHTYKNFNLKSLQKYEINPLARNDEDLEELSNTKYSRIIQEKLDFLNVISNEDIKFDLKINKWNPQKQNFEYLSGKKLNLKKHTSETLAIAKYEDIIFDYKDFYLIKLIFSSKKKAKPANKEFCGIQNEKNTCYLNSIFQILFNLKVLRKQIFSILSNEGTPLFLMQQAFFEMQKLNRNDIRLLGFIRAMDFDESIQNDFAEIFFFLFEMLSEFEKSVKGESVLHQLCTGVYRTHIKCREIDHESTKREPFLLLQLDITDCKNLIQCFEKFLSVEKMTEDNKYELEDRSKHEAIKSLHFESLPPILFISLMRFEYKEEQIRKKFDKIVYEEFVDLGHYIMSGGKDGKETEKGKKGASHKYELFGVVVHDGNAEGGHYYSFFKECKSRYWVKFNDSKTSYVSEFDVFEKNFGGKEKHIDVYDNGDISVEYNGNSRTAYVLVYLQQEKIEEILADVSEADLNETLLEFLNNPSTTNTKNPIKNNPKKNLWDLNANGLTDEKAQKNQETKPFIKRKVNTRSSYKPNSYNSSTLNQIKPNEAKTPSNLSYDFIKNLTSNINMVGNGQEIFWEEGTKDKKNKSKKDIITLEFPKEKDKNLIFPNKDNDDIHQFSTGQDISNEILKCSKINENEISNYTINKHFNLREQRIIEKLNNVNNKNLKRKNIDESPKTTNAEKKMAKSLSLNKQGENVQILLEVDKADEEPNSYISDSIIKNPNSDQNEKAVYSSLANNNILNNNKFDYKSHLLDNQNFSNGKNTVLFSNNTVNTDFIERKKRESDSLKVYKLKLFMNNYKDKFIVEDLIFNSNDLKASGANFFQELIEKNVSKNPDLKGTLHLINLENLKLVVLTNMGICLQIIDTSDSKALKEALNKFHSKEIYVAIYHFPSDFLPKELGKTEHEVIITVNFIDNLRENRTEFDLHKNDKVRLPLIFYGDKRELYLEILYCLLLERITNSSSKFEELNIQNKVFFINNNEKDIMGKKKYTSIMFDDLNDLALITLKKNKILRIVCETDDYLREEN